MYCWTASRGVRPKGVLAIVPVTVAVKSQGLLRQTVLMSQTWGMSKVL